MWENFIEELLSVWAYLWEREKLPGEEAEDDNEKRKSLRP